jgi:hypothetical protein
LAALGERFKPELCSENNRKKQRVYFKKRKILNERLSGLSFPENNKRVFLLTAKDVASKTIVSISGESKRNMDIK